MRIGGSGAEERSVRTLLNHTTAIGRELGEARSQWGHIGERVGKPSHPGPPESRRRIEDPPLSVPSTAPASSGAIRAAFSVEDTSKVRPRRSQRRARGAGIANQVDNDTDADDERLFLVPQDVIDALESDLAVEDPVGSVEVFTMTDEAASEEFEGPQVGRRVVFGSSER